MSYIVQQQREWKLSGIISVDTANTVLKESLLFGMDEEALVVDFGGVTDVDTAAISLMLEWMRRAKTEFCKISFKNLPENLLSLVALYGVDQFIPRH